MKKYILIVGCILTSTGLFAQSMNVQSASNSLKDKDLAAAKGFIDKAAENEQTSNNYKMWYYRAKIYFSIDTSRTEHNLDKDAAEKAVISYINCLKTDTKKWYEEECLASIWVAGLGLFNAGIEAYNQKDYERAIRYFNQMFEVYPYDKDKSLNKNNAPPEIMNKNLYFAYNRMGNNTKAKEYLQKLMDGNFNDPNIYMYMEKINLQEKDTAAALSILEKGRSRFEENADLLNEELNIYIAQGKTDMLLNKLTDAIALNPEHELLYFNRGTIYEKKKDFAKAEADYKKTIELNDRYFDAYYNLGGMIFNQGAEMANTANGITDTKKYEVAKKNADAKLAESLPFLEKAYDLNPKDKNTLISLKQLYARMNNQEKYTAIKAELDKLSAPKK